MNNDPLIFKLAKAQGKPSSFRKDKDHTCPFCDIESLTDIYKREGEFIWLHNRFPTLQDTLQTVLIEATDHNGDISNYSVEHNRKLMRFALGCFQQVAASNKYKSVLWYKNFGPLSGGSLIHPHMQIVGLEQEDGYKYIHKNNFMGISAFENENVEVNLATYPVQGYQEININLKSFDQGDAVDLWSDWIRKSTKYILTEMYNGRCNSYNLFFYPYKKDQVGNYQRLCCKVIPRFYAPPYFVGYKLSQCNDEVTLKKEALNLSKFNY